MSPTTEDKIHYLEEHPNRATRVDENTLSFEILDRPDLEPILVTKGLSQTSRIEWLFVDGDEGAWFDNPYWLWDLFHDNPATAQSGGHHAETDLPHSGECPTPTS